MTVTFITAGFIGLLMIYTMINTGIMRGKTKTLLGEGDDIYLLGAIRAHGNLTEYAPIALILIGAMEYMQTNATLVMGMGTVFVVARVCHAIGLIKHPDREKNTLRALGAIGTLTVMVVASITVLIKAYGLM